MSGWTIVTYSGYWDVPRVFVVGLGQEAYFFESLFNEALDDYAPNFTVYRIPVEVSQIPKKQWVEFKRIGTKLADVPVDQVRFRREQSPYDERRQVKMICDDVLDLFREEGEAAKS